MVHKVKSAMPLFNMILTKNDFLKKVQKKETKTFLSHQYESTTDLALSKVFLSFSRSTRFYDANREGINTSPGTSNLISFPLALQKE